MTLEEIELSLKINIANYVDQGKSIDQLSTLLRINVKEKDIQDPLSLSKHRSPVKKIINELKKNVCVPPPELLTKLSSPMSNAFYI